MKKKSKSVAIYGAIVFFVMSIAIFDYWSENRATERQSKESLILNLSLDQISQLKMNVKTGVIELEKTVDGWKMKSPVQDSANSQAVDEFIEGISAEKSTGIAAQGEVDLKAYGLDQPKASIELITNSGKSEKFLIGSVKNYQGDAFLLKEEGANKKVQVVSSTWHTRAEKTAMELRDRRLMRLSNVNTDKILIEANDFKLQFAREGMEWKSASHPEWKLNQNKVRELINKLNITDAIEFLADGSPTPLEEKTWGFNSGQTKIAVFSEGKVIWSARIAKGPDKVTRALVNPPAFILKIDPADLAIFKIPLDRYRDRSEPFIFVKEKAKKIIIKYAGKQVELDASDPKARDLISQLQKLELDRFDEMSKENLDNFIEIKDETGNSQFLLQWSKVLDLKDNNSERNAVYAKSSIYKGLFSILESELSSLKLDEILAIKNENQDTKADKKNEGKP